MLRVQLPHSMNVAERNSWTGYHIKILATDHRTATESFSMRESKSTFKSTLQGRGIYPSFPTLFVCGLSLSCLCTHSDALYQPFEAGVQGWQVFARKYLFFCRESAETKGQRSCGED